MTPFTRSAISILVALIESNNCTRDAEAILKDALEKLSLLGEREKKQNG